MDGFIKQGFFLKALDMEIRQLLALLETDNSDRQYSLELNKAELEKLKKLENIEGKITLKKVERQLEALIIIGPG